MKRSSLEIFSAKLLDSLIECGSVKYSLISNRICISLRKHSTIENSNPQGNLSSFKEDLIEDLNKFKKTFFAEFKSL